jgi:hypothetical protein
VDLRFGGRRQGLAAIGHSGQRNSLDERSAGRKGPKIGPPSAFGPIVCDRLPLAWAPVSCAGAGNSGREMEFF